jgi:hypothetical protein
MKGRLMHLAICHFVALERGAPATAQAIEREIKRRGFPGAEVLIRHRHAEREAGRMLPFPWLETAA